MTAIADLPDIRPSLLLDFANSGRVDPRIQCTRASAATCWGPDGKLRTVPANTPRIDYDPVTGKCLGLLVEEARTNLFHYSNDLTNSYWNKANATIEAGVSTGAGSLALLKEVAVTNDTPRLWLTATTVAGNGYVVTVEAKEYTVGPKRYLQVWANSGFPTTGGSIGANFDLATGVATLVSGPDVKAFCVPVGGGVYRCSVYFGVATTTTPGIRIGLQSTPTATMATGWNPTGTGGMYVGNLMLEQGASPTSYIPTTGVAATRAADVVTLQAPSYTDLSVLAEFTHGNKLANTRAMGLYAASATSSSIQVIAANDAGTASAGVIASPTGPNTRIADLAVVSGRTDRVAFSRAKDGAMLTSARGARLVSGVHTGVTAPMDTIALGNSTATGSLNLCGHIRRVTLYPSALSQNQLNKLTAV